MAKASSAITTYRGHPCPTAGTAKATAAPPPTNTVSVPMAASSKRERLSSGVRRAIRLAHAAPTRNTASEVRVAGTENPGAPAAAKPSTTTLPVMLAVNTRPSPR